MTDKPRMDTDALKAAMAALGDPGDDLVLSALFAAGKAKRSVGALARWQVVQVGAGVLIVLAGAMVWSSLIARPGLLFASGLLIHLYGVVMIALGVAGLAHAVRIDLSAPIIETERNLALLFRVKLASGWFLGASWWVLWLPAIGVFFRLLWGVDVLAAIGLSGWLSATLATGIVGWVGLWWLRSWALRHGRAGVVAQLDDMMTGQSFVAVRRRLHEVATFADG